MRKTTFVNGQDRQFVEVGDLPEVTPKAICTHHPGSDEDLQLLEVKVPPGGGTSPHAHETDEILVVTEGEMRFGSRVFGPGSSVYIPKFTLYSYQAGPGGLTFLNFRARQDLTAIRKDQILEHRAVLQGKEALPSETSSKPSKFQN